MNTYYSEIIKSNCYFSAPVNYKSCKSNESFKTYLELDHQFKKQIIPLTDEGKNTNNSKNALLIETFKIRYISIGV